MTDPILPTGPSTPSTSSTPPDSPTSPPDGAGAPAEDRPSTLMGQFGRTKDGFRRLINAHIDLLKAEINEILGKIAVIAGQAGMILLFSLVTFAMLYVGGLLFLGEWLFGSIGWGFAHGVLLGFALITNIAFVILGAKGRRLVAAFIVAVLFVIAVAALCASNVAYNAAAGVAAGLPQPLGTPGVVALLGGIVIGAILFTVLLARVAGRNGAIAGFFVGAIFGAIVGWLIAGAPWTIQPAVGFAITIGLIVWIMLAVIFALPGLDPAEKFSKLYPQQSIESFEESRAWLEEQWRSRQPKLGRK